MKRISGLVLMAVLVLSAVLVHGEMFKDGETVCFLGDSITNGGRYQGVIINYYLTRFPDKKIRFVNAGRSGDTSGGSLKRIKLDLVDKKPTSVAIMFGMNDVGRGYYVTNPDEKRLAGQKRALDGYKKNMEKVVARVRSEAKEPKLYFLTPSPFDQSGINDRDNNQPGCNDGLGRCAEMVRAMAVANNGALVEFHKPMTAFNLEQQKKDPKYTIVGPDRVHPGDPGLLMMAWLFLKEQGASPVVSTVKIDAAAQKAGACVNAELMSILKAGETLSFVVQEGALPMPVSSRARPILELLPIEKDLNQELLYVSGLAAGTYALKIDGVEVGQYKSDDLAKGINLAFNKLTPQYKQAQEIAKKVDKARNADLKWRDLLNSRRWMINHYKLDADDPAVIQAHYDHFKDKKSYTALKTKQYIAGWPKFKEYVATAEKCENEIYSGRKPIPHNYELVPVE
ncbi:MAG: SGNH/GDSL hydrolase family protein [Kiritimatiellae bacterium]|jgi:lysophospholipase L1-like esterase|nr:SGNH/GDSL hydrolase family protein [Kiritimatiellia bacterium]